jgi:hypothetical protein
VGFLRPFSLMDFCILIVPFHTLFILILEFVCVCFKEKWKEDPHFSHLGFASKRTLEPHFFNRVSIRDML